MITGLGGVSGTRSSTVSEEEIQKAKEEYEARQKKRKEKEEKEKEDKKGKDVSTKDEKDGVEKKEREKAEEKKAATVQSPSSSGGSSPPTNTHQRYTLHREIFAMRLDIHKKRRQAAQAKNIAPRLPSAPRGSLS